MEINIKEYLSYDQQTGIFTWIKQRKGHNINTIAGSLNSDGYVSIKFNQKRYKAHRLAWFFYYNEWPKYFLDHINGARNDNRIKNLRIATNRQNQLNQHKHRNGKLPYAYLTKYNKWQSSVGGKHLGVFQTDIAAYKTAIEYLISKKQELYIQEV